ncbi:MAG TPA: hypothetical protein VG937_06530 [Polyangiaceae bacterium]|jgi:hypothetical protein|nr:hypothetical protein [Polyangiaceae bacterium]
MSNDTIEEEVRVAEQSVEQAEAALTALLARLTTAPRAEKVGVSAPLEAALRSLQDAHAALEALRP